MQWKNDSLGKLVPETYAEIVHKKQLVRLLIKVDAETVHKKQLVRLLIEALDVEKKLWDVSR